MREVPPPEVSAALHQLPAVFGQLGLQSGDSNLDVKALKGQPGLYRLRVGDWRAVFVRSDRGLLVSAIGLRKDIYERVARMRLARKGEGVRVVELRAPGQEPERARAPAHKQLAERTPTPVGQNPMSPFSDVELVRLEGVDVELVAWLRRLPPTVDIGEALATRLEDPDLAVLLIDLWERPERFVEVFSSGGAPSMADLWLGEEELASRLTSPESGTEVVRTETEALIRRLLGGTIEDWMVYLHPSQRAVASAETRGPARVRGGPGTGKTVVALHRARWLARRAGDGRVLLTTFLRTLPAVWEGLMQTLEPRALERLEVVNLDALALRIVNVAGGGPVSIVDGARRSSIAKTLLPRHGLTGLFSGNENLLLEEFDAFLTGRGTTEPEDYFALRRRGGGIPLVRAERERVWTAYGEYQRQLERWKQVDFGMLRLRALGHVHEGAGPRYSGVVVDEAQDLTEVGVGLLYALDSSSDHRDFMVVGDGQQSIYPGGFSLRSLGIDVRGRAWVLSSNWRNTWSVWTAARAVMDGEAFDDLDEDVGLRPIGEEPGPQTVGDSPVLHVVRSPGDEFDLLAALVQERIASGVDPGDIAVLVDVKRKGKDATRALEGLGLKVEALERYEGTHAAGVLVGTFQRAKGLEFKEVVIPGMSASEWPSRYFVPPDLTPEQREDRIALQLRTLFVGMTRARDRLTLLSGGAPAAPVERAAWAMEVREY